MFVIPRQISVLSPFGPVSVPLGFTIETEGQVRLYEYDAIISVVRLKATFPILVAEVRYGEFNHLYAFDWILSHTDHAPQTVTNMRKLTMPQPEQ